MNLAHTLLQMDWSKYVVLFLQLAGALHIALWILATVFTAIPGAEPERTLYKLADFFSRFSRKKND